MAGVAANIRARPAVIIILFIVIPSIQIIMPAAVCKKLSLLPHCKLLNTDSRVPLIQTTRLSCARPVAFRPIFVGGLAFAVLCYQ
jgi:hypothetical protein